MRSLFYFLAIAAIYAQQPVVEDGLTVFDPSLIGNSNSIDDFVSTYNPTGLDISQPGSHTYTGTVVL